MSLKYDSLQLQLLMITNFRFNKQTSIIGQPNKFDELHDKILYIAQGHFLRGASLALGCTPAMPTVWPCVGCSTQPSQPGVFRSTSALITILYSCTTDGKRTCEFWTLMRLRLSRIRPAHIRSLSDSSEPFAVSFWTTLCSGTQLTSRESLQTSKGITIIRARMPLSMAIRPLKSVVTMSHNPLRYKVIRGKSIVAVCFNYQLPLE